LLPLERLTPKQVLTHRTLNGRGDMNCDSLVDFADINPFVLALSNPTAYGNTFPGCDITNGDINCNGQFGFDDIDPFVACLTQGACPHYEACAFCGDGVVDSGEDCDGTNHSEQTCQTLGYDSGDLNCNPDCTFNTEECQQGSGEECTSNDDCTLCYQCVEQQCVPKDELCADFKVYELMSVDPVTGEEDWQKIDLENGEIENGLRVKLDASVSSGNPAWYFFDYGDGTYNPDPSSPTDKHQFFQDRIITLSIYTADWSQWQTVQKTVHVDAGMQWLSTMPYAPGFVTSAPGIYALSDNQLWIVSVLSSLSVADISDPYNLGGFNVVKEYVSGVQSVAVNYDNLFVRRNVPPAIFVEVYDINPFNEIPYIIPSSEFEGVSPSSVAATEHTLYVATYSNNKIHVFDTTSGIPQLVQRIPVNNVGELFTTQTTHYLVSVSSSGEVNVFNIEQPLSPVQLLGSPVQLPPSYGPLNAKASDTMLSYRTGAYTSILLRFADIAQYEEPPFQTISISSNNFALGDERYYSLTNAGSTAFVDKYNTLNVFEEPYLMDNFYTGKAGMKSSFILDADNEGPIPSVLMIGHNGAGYSSYTP
ncbi:MAG: hypothetical protein KKD18_02440, partial [Nanoarchaeota archaeon]|nr:hypothetical protein [Nanoarchaeota archaeon]